MTAVPSENTKALLMLTAPLQVGRSAAPRELLTPAEYNQLARELHALKRIPADLLGPDRREWIVQLRGPVDPTRLERLLSRGFLLTQALERWRSRAIWVVSRADETYPRSLKTRLRERTPPILYGCGQPSQLDTGGLAVVGSRDAGHRLLDETEAIGRAAAVAGRTVVSGGARGVDQAAMRGALEAGGRVVGVLSDGLARAAVAREHREFLMKGRLTLVTPCDPTAAFHVGNAMQRNKLIYALADAALVMAAQKPSGTWSGAEEQLRRHRFIPVFTWSKGDGGAAIRELQGMGARPWPNPQTREAWIEVFSSLADRPRLPEQVREASLFEAPSATANGKSAEASGSEPAAAEDSCADALLARFRELLARTDSPRKAPEIARAFNLTLAQTNHWLKRLVDDGLVEKLQKPVRFRCAVPVKELFSTTRRRA